MAVVPALFPFPPVSTTAVAAVCSGPFSSTPTDGRQHACGCCVPEVVWSARSVRRCDDLRYIYHCGLQLRQRLCPRNTSTILMPPVAVMMVMVVVVMMVAVSVCLALGVLLHFMLNTNGLQQALQQADGIVVQLAATRMHL